MRVNQLCAFFVRLNARVEIELHDKNKKNEAKLAKDVIVEFSTLNYWCAISIDECTLSTDFKLIMVKNF